MAEKNDPKPQPPTPPRRVETFTPPERRIHEVLNNSQKAGRLPPTVSDTIKPPPRPKPSGGK